jgi:hypothetical protein
MWQLAVANEGTPSGFIFRKKVGRNGWSILPTEGMVCFIFLSLFSPLIFFSPPIPSWNISATIFWTLVLILGRMAPILFAEEDVNTLPWFSAGVSATFAHGVGGLKILTTRVPSSNIYGPGLIHLSLSAKTILTLTVP